MMAMRITVVAELVALALAPRFFLEKSLTAMRYSGLARGPSWTPIHTRNCESRGGGRDPDLIAGLELETPHAVVRNSFRGDLARIAEELTRHDSLQP